jgi:hypothetical protein
MTRTTSFDVQIGGVPYLLVKDASGAPDLALGATPKEPTTAGEIGTLKFPTFHHGPGGKVDMGEGRFYADPAASGPSLVTYRPGKVHSAGAIAALTPAAYAFSSSADFFGHSFREYTTVGGVQAEYIFFILSLGVFAVNTSTWAVTFVRENPTGFRFTGSCAKWNNKWWLGVESAARNVGHMETMAVATGAWTTSTIDAAHVYAARGKFYWAGNTLGYGPTSLYWSDHDDLSTAAGPYTLDTGGFSTWLYALGPWLLVMKQDGCVYAMDDEGVFSPIVKSATISRSDPGFGHGAIEYRGQLLIPGQGQLIALDMASLGYTNIHPLVMQPGCELGIGMGLGRPSLAMHGDNLYLGLARECSGVIDASLWTLVDWGDGPAWHPLCKGTNGFLVDNIKVPEAISLYSDAVTGATRLAFTGRCTANTNTAVGYLCIPSPDFSVGPATGIDTAYAITQAHGGDGVSAGVTKRFGRVRGWADANWQFSILIDNSGTPTVVGATSADGPFAFDVPSSVVPGRYASLKIKRATGYPEWKNISLPLYVDYSCAPAMTDDLRLGILAGQEQQHNLGGAWRRRNSKDIVDAISALVGTVTTLEFGGAWSGTTWNILILGYDLKEAEGPARDEGSKVLYVYLRRL